MSYDKESRAQKRYRDHVAIAKQFRILQHYTSYRFPQKPPVMGKLRKHHGTNCGNSRCHLCVNPRRLFGFVTIKEVSQNEAFAFEMKSLDDAA